LEDDFVDLHQKRPRLLLSDMIIASLVFVFCFVNFLGFLQVCSLIGTVFLIANTRDTLSTSLDDEKGRKRESTRAYARSATNNQFIESLSFLLKFLFHL